MLSIPAEEKISHEIQFYCLREKQTADQFLSKYMSASFLIDFNI